MGSYDVTAAVFYFTTSKVSGRLTSDFVMVFSITVIVIVSMVVEGSVTVLSLQCELS